MESIKIHPWQGAKFSSSQKRILFIGESHYQSTLTSDLDPEFTQKVVDSYISGNWNHRFFTGISRIASGLEARETWNKRTEIWENIAFYNYIQEIVGNDSRMGFYPDKVKKSEAAFFELLKSLKATHAVILSKRLWTLMPNGISEHVRDERLYQYGDADHCLALGLRHPSGRAFKAMECRKRYLDFLG